MSDKVDIVYNDRFSELNMLMREVYTPEEVELVIRAYEMAKEAHKDQQRFSGEPYIMHPVAVARILFDLGMDYESIAAAILHDVVEDTDITLEILAERFNEDIANLVNGVTKLGKVQYKSSKERQAENVRKMFIAMSHDIRVIIIKLADRLHNMRTLEYMREDKQIAKSLETLEIYAPIAHRLGISSLKEELEDLSIHYLDPYGCLQIEKLLEDTEKNHPTLVKTTMDKITERVKSEVPNAYIKGRTKSIYGIYRKMFMQGRNFDEIYDVYAARIIVDTVAECYTCLGIIHDMYHSLPYRFKDYISTPKSNMYQSLHTTVISDGGIPFEVQIRTREMDFAAEYGIAAHWKYKLGMGGKNKFEERVAWIRQLLENQQDADDVEDIVRTIKTDFTPDDVFVFTPKGDVMSVPAGSTVIDFAYAIHTQVGHHMNGAKVDGRIVPLDYEVKTGEIVEILRSSDPNKGPSRDWLKICTTAGARSKIRAWFKKEKRPENIETGKVEIDRMMRRNNLHFNEEEVLAICEKLKERKGFEDIEDFYAAIGYGSVTIDSILPTFREEYAKIEKQRTASLVDEREEQSKIFSQKKYNSSEGIVIDGVDNVLIKLSKCCNPLPGDDVIGFITRGHGISVHKRDCNNVPKVISEADEPERWISVVWNAKKNQTFQANLCIYCSNSIGMMADISGALATLRVNIQSITMNNKSEVSMVNMLIVVNSLDHLNNVIKTLKKIPGVHDVERTGM